MLNTENIQLLIDSGEGYNVEFKVRVPSKVRELTEEICAFANADGGYLLIGIDDNGQIIGTSLENDKRSAIQGSISEISPTLHCELYTVNIEDKTVWVIDVPSGKDKPYIFSGSIFVREGANSQKLRTVEEMRSFFQECNKIFFDAIPCSWFNIYTDADEQAIKDFRTEAQLSPSTADKQIFENLELFTDKGVAKNGAAMFFGKQPERKFPHAITRCVLFKGTTKVFIIDDKGVVRLILIYPMNVGRCIPEILRALTALQVADSNKLSMPANWVPCQPGIIPPPQTFEALEKRKREIEKNQNGMTWYLSFQNVKDCEKIGQTSYEGNKLE